MYIVNTEVIEHDGIHQFNKPKSGKIALSTGFHNIKVWYFQGLPTRMGLLLEMKKEMDNDWKPFDLKPLEDDIKKLKQSENGKLNIVFNDKMLFDIGQYTLKTEAYDKLMAIVKVLKFNPNAKVRIEGHTDNIGSDKSNQLLSENRAKAVQTFLCNVKLIKAHFKIV